MSYSQQKEQVTLTAFLEDQGDPDTTYPYDKTREQLLKVISEGIPVDLITVDQIWLGEFAENGLLTDLTNYTQKWGRSINHYCYYQPQRIPLASSPH